MTNAPPSVSASAHVALACNPVVAWEFVTGLDPVGYYPSYGPLPAVVAVRDQTGDWVTVGHERTLVLSDGGFVIERLTDARSPGVFAYDLRDFQKIFGRLVSGARAEWTFEPTTHGTRLGWTYAFHPRRGRRWIVAAIVRLAWAPYMRRVLPGIARDIPTST